MVGDEGKSEARVRKQAEALTKAMMKEAEATTKAIMQGAPAQEALAEFERKVQEGLVESERKPQGAFAVAARDMQRLTGELQSAATTTWSFVEALEKVKEKGFVPCEYCKSLMLQTATSCPHCGAPRKAQKQQKSPE